MCCLLDYPSRNMEGSGAKCDLMNYGCPISRGFTGEECWDMS